MSTEKYKSLSDEDEAEKYFGNKEELDLDFIIESLGVLMKSNENLAKKLENLKFKITWELPKMHQTTKGLFRSKNEGKIKTQLTEEEKEYLHFRITQFCEKNNLNLCDIRSISKTSIKFTMSAQTRIKFLQYLCKNLSGRTPTTVYNYIKRLGCRTGRFSLAEDILLMELYKCYSGPNFYHLCAQLLNRHRINIYMHFRKLKESMELGPRPKLKRNKVVPSEGILKSVLVRCKDGKKILQTTCFGNGSWKAIGKENNISAAFAKSVYLCDLLPRVCSNKSIYYYQLCCLLIERIANIDVSDLSRLLGRLEKEYDISSLFFYFLLRKLIQTYVPQESWGNFSECQSILETEALPSIKEKQHSEGDFIMSRLILEE